MPKNPLKLCRIAFFSPASSKNDILWRYRFGWGVIMLCWCQLLWRLMCLCPSVLLLVGDNGIPKQDCFAASHELVACLIPDASILELSGLMLDDPHSAIAHAAIIHYYNCSEASEPLKKKTSFPNWASILTYSDLKPSPNALRFRMPISSHEVDGVLRRSSATKELILAQNRRVVSVRA